jgi:exopolyphosphatase/guanosine-5'-triphosphate,3'-diphosphate pyrophosphatase
MRKWPDKEKKVVEKYEAGRLGQQTGSDNYAAIDLGTNSCRLVIATPTPSSFRIIETFSKITRLGEGIINNNELSHTAIRRTINALRVCAGVLEEYAPIKRARHVALIPYIVDRNNVVTNPFEGL